MVATRSRTPKKAAPKKAKVAADKGGAAVPVKGQAPAAKKTKEKKAAGKKKPAKSKKAAAAQEPEEDAEDAEAAAAGEEPTKLADHADVAGGHNGVWPVLHRGMAAVGMQRYPDGDYDRFWVRRKKAAAQDAALRELGVEPVLRAGWRHRGVVAGKKSAKPKTVIEAGPVDRDTPITKQLDPTTKPVSGRWWKNTTQTPRSAIVVKSKTKNKRWKERMERKKCTQDVKTLQSELTQAASARKQGEREKREAKAKRREENEIKSQVVQVVTNTRKLKKLNRKQLRQYTKWNGQQIGAASFNTAMK